MENDEQITNKNHTSAVNEQDTIKYDRQIRLFRFETQKKLLGVTIQILGTTNYVSAEILKNLTLLGIKKVIIDRKTLDFIKKIVPDDLNDINKNLIIEFSDKIVKSDFLFLVDVIDDNKSAKYYYVCSKCLTIVFSDINHDCSESEKYCKTAAECLLGAFAVQEFLKYIQDQDYCIKYKIEL